MIPGLFLRVFPTGARSFALDRMTRGRRRFATLGNADTLTIPETRAEARRFIATFADTAKKDGGPRTPGHPMDTFAGEFLDRQARHWKPSTLESNAYMVRKYILPAFGHMTVDAIAVEHVKYWFASMAEQPGSANRAMPVLSVMMRMAELWGYRRHNSNPCKNAERFRMELKARFLDIDELARLRRALDAREAEWPEAVAAIRLLALTGWRRSEVLNLRWRNIGADALNLEDSKTGPRAVPLGEAARAGVAALQGAGGPHAQLQQCDSKDFVDSMSYAGAAGCLHYISGV